MTKQVNKLFASLRGKRVLVTGHTGFKGGWLALWLSDVLGAKVTGYALDPPTKPSLFEMAHLSDFVTHEVGDVRDFGCLREVVSRDKIEVIFHLAAQPLVRYSYAEPKETFDVNVGGTTNVLEVARQTSSVRAVIVITSDKCYENREWVFGYRENEAMGGHDPYSASKGAAEIVTAAYRRSFGGKQPKGRTLAIASVRAGNVIGGGDFATDRIVPDAVRAVQQGKPLDVRHPSSTRPWQHVLDPLGGYLLLTEKMLAAPELYADAFNFGPSFTGITTVADLIERFYSELGKGRYVDVSQRNRRAVHEARFLHLSCEKAQAVLDWHPVLTLNQSLQRTAAWYRDVILRDKDALLACRRDIRFYETNVARLRKAAIGTRDT